jgi:hypothetical protein
MIRLSAVHRLASFLLVAALWSGAATGDCGGKPLTAPTGDTPAETLRGDALCRLVRDIRELPHKPEFSSDPAYDRLLRSNGAANACLIKLISNEEIIPDPRECGPFRQDDFRLGDLAFFLLWDFNATLELDRLLPAAAAQDYRERGIVAYFDWIKGPGRRTELQRHVAAQFRGNAPVQ